MATEEKREAPRSVPDAAKLNNMVMRTVTVTKLTSKTGPGQLVVPPWKGVSVDQINGLLTLVPQQQGPGTYRFEIYDDSGDKDIFTAKLGAGNVPELPEASMSPLPMPTYAGAPGAVPGSGGGYAGSGGGYAGSGGGYAGVGGGHVGVNPDGSRVLGHGYVYDAETGTLTTPAKQIFNWRPGEAIPGSLNSSPSSWPAGTTWMPGQGPMPPQQGNYAWGQLPAVGGGDDKIEALKEQLRLAEERRKDDERRREMDDMRNTFKTLAEESQKRFEAVLAKITEKPSGPSSEMLAMQARLDAAERSAEQARRESADREREAEARRREDMLRQEMKANAERTETLIREIAGKKEDPMIPVFGQIIAAQQAASSSFVTAMRDSTTVQAKAAEENSRLVADRLAGSILTPDRTVELIRLAKDRGPEHEASKGLAEMYKTVFGMAQDLIRVQAEVNSQSQGPSWAPFVEQGMNQLGRIAQVYATTKAKEQVQVQAQAQAQQAQRSQPRRVVHNNPGRVVGQGPAGLSAVPVRAPTPEEIRNSAAEAVFGPKGSDGRPSGRPVAAAAPAAPAAPARRGRPPGRRAAIPVAASAVPVPVAPTPAPVPEPIANVPVAAVRSVVDQLSDEEIFGPALPHVLELRKDAEPDDQGNEVDPVEVANFVFQARQQFQAYGVFPPCMELLQNGHIEILLERLLPNASPEFRNEVADVIRVRLREEDSGAIANGDAAA